MVRKITIVQYNSMMRREVNRQNQQIRRYNTEVNRVNRANKKNLDDHNRDVRRHNNAVRSETRRQNQKAKTAVSKYNQAVRAHNLQVNSNRKKLGQQIAALKKRPATTQYTNVRTSTYDLHDSFEQAERETPNSPLHADLIALSERESSNSIAVMNTLLNDSTIEQIEEIGDTGILDYLAGFSEDLCDRWKGALFALNPANTDAARHFCTSVREIFTEILEVWANDKDVISADSNCQRTQQGKPTRRAKIHYLLDLKGIHAPELAGFVEADIENIVELFSVFNKATHGSAGKHSFAKLQVIRQRVEGGIMFLAAVAT